MSRKTNIFIIAKFILLEIMPTRKEFQLNGNPALPIKAGGIILYKIEKDKVYLLLIQKEGEYEDLGGKTEFDDETILDVVSREAYEESNNLLDIKSLKERLPLSNYAYNLNSKYIVYLVKANENEAQLTTKDFGEREIHDDIPRQIHWVSTTTVLNPNIIKYKISMRLKTKEFFNMIRNIEKNLDEWDVICK
jgi:hypothetical protein